MEAGVGKTEEDSNGLQLGFSKTVQYNFFQIKVCLFCLEIQLCMLDRHFMSSNIE